jgi:glycosyltransferase involved in cell wall biosynthesis
MPRRVSRILAEVETRNHHAISAGHEPGLVSASPLALFPNTQATRGPERVVKRVAVVSIFREGCGGGSGFATYGLARRLAERFETAIVSPGDATALVVDGTRLRRITVISTGKGQTSYPLLDRTNVARLFALLDEFGPDVVHAHDTIQLALLVQLWATERHVPFVLTFHLLPGRELEFGLGDRMPVFNSYLMRPLVWHYLASFYERCDGGVMMHDAVERLLNGRPRPARIFRVSSALDLGQFRQCRPALTAGPVYNLCFVGFLSERKNQMYLLEMMKHLPRNYRLALVGETLRPDYELRLRDYAVRAGLDNVEFVGRVPHDAIPQLLERAHVFVSASRLEVQATVINEALASGTPVVALDNETLDLIDDSVGYHLDKDTSPAEFARCVRHICSLPKPEYEAMCLRARERVCGMDWSGVVEQHLAAYEAILAERHDAILPVAEKKLAATRSYARVTMSISTAMYHLHQGRVPVLTHEHRSPAAF